MILKSRDELKMKPDIRIISEKKLVGLHSRMSLTKNTTRELWKSFMSRRREIQHAVGSDFISMQTYSAGYFENFNPETEFEKWATVEVCALDSIPENMNVFYLPEGMYAVFLHKGSAGSGPELFRYIFGVWLSDSEYTLDNRPHFELLGEKYKNDDPESEEEIFIPIKKKATNAI